VYDLDADGLGRVHRAAAAQRHQPVTPRLAIQRARLTDELHVRVRTDPVEHERAFQVL
jgi:hypothetical protein